LFLLVAGSFGARFILVWGAKWARSIRGTKLRHVRTIRLRKGIPSAAFHGSAPGRGLEKNNVRRPERPPHRGADRPQRRGQCGPKSRVFHGSHYEKLPPRWPEPPSSDSWRTLAVLRRLRRKPLNRCAREPLHEIGQTSGFTIPRKKRNLRRSKGDEAMRSRNRRQIEILRNTGHCFTWQSRR